ncbi:hypothetical protein [Microbispora hainanensis]|jgi:hypothetical protein|uniref:hypothetical protein n=1 Tax=Microbispora hainanensis TaxID=568844 RepID=UPI0033EF7F02
MVSPEEVAGAFAPGTPGSLAFSRAAPLLIFFHVNPRIREALSGFLAPFDRKIPVIGGMS